MYSKLVGARRHIPSNRKFLAVMMAALVLVPAAITGHASAADPPMPRLPKIRVAPDGRTFVTEDGKPFVPLGVNYYRPGTGWAPQLWKKFDAEATRRDFARMKALGVNCVRVFLSYGSFFMEPDTLSPEGLAKFDQFLAMAEAAGVYVHPTGPDHWEGTPAWVSKDRIADPDALAAVETFWRMFADRYRGRSVIFAYDLLNEPAAGWDSPAMSAKWNAWLQSRYGSAEKTAEAWGASLDSVQWGKLPVPAAKDSPNDRRLLDYQHFREAVADEWTGLQVKAIKAADPQALVTVGLIQWSVPALLPGVQHYSAFHPRRQAKLLDFLEVHFYPLESGFYDYANDEAERRNLAYLESVVREVAAAEKPVVLAEFGWYGGGKLTIDDGRHPAATSQQQARWCRQAVETTRGLATGWLNWGFYDHPEARDVSQLTGLLSVDGKPKPWADEFERLGGSLAGQVQAPLPLGPRPELNWDRCVTSLQAGREFREEYYKAFLARQRRSNENSP
ncbi:MAG: cellulase family glycosylhydrolase [Planctomycetia bacterium]|nr:cellulase family glycosylhydrolase [Planctomycetia bacterium]